MKHVTVIVAILLGLIVAPGAALADAPTVVSGGGTGSVAGEPFSQFGFGLSVRGGVARGHFECVMAGRSAFPGLHVMKVEGRVTSATASATAATFSGSGKLRADNLAEDVTFVVTVIEGGPGLGQLQLTVFGSTFVGSPVFALPPETVASGRIDVR